MILRITFFLLITISLQAQTIEPNKVGEELVTALQQNYSPSGTIGYGPARDTLYSAIDNDGLELSGVYTDFTVTLDPTMDPSISAFQNGQGINAEHVYPQSKGAGNEPQRSDMHNIFPSKVNVNEARSACEFGEIDDSDTDRWFFLTTLSTNIPATEIEKYSEKDDNDCFFEPREEVKGDIARAMFYFYTIYQSAANGADPNFFAAQKMTLLQWHLADPVTQKEITRDSLIASHQGNSNPFILDVTLAERAYCFTNSVDDLEEESWVAISTNVLQNEFTIFSERENGKVLLYDGVGRLIKRDNLNYEVNWNVGNLPKGNYVLQVSSENSVKVFQLFKTF